MEKMRAEIRAAFEKEQAAHPPIMALRRNVVEAVIDQPRRETNYQWLAVAAALLLGILVVMGLMSTRLVRPTIAPVTHKIPVGDLGPPPAGVPLVYIHDPNHPGWLIGIDWNGKARGTVKFDKSLTYLRMAPDGSMFGGDSQRQGKGGITEYYDRLGNPIASPSSTSALLIQPSQMWADDNRHLCGVSYSPTFAWTFVTQLPGEATRTVGVVSQEQGIGQTSVSLASCSFRNDQAILVRIAVASPTDMWVIRISDGKVIRHVTFPSLNLATIIASRDSAFFAENPSKSTEQQGPSMTATVRRVSDLSAVATLKPEQGVLAFSADDSLALVTTSPWVDGVPTHFAVIDVKSGKVRWTYEGQEVLGSFLGQPDGNGFVIALKGSGQGQDPARDLLIVRGDGTETKIPDRYVPAW
jgi:hypothetical protein